MVAGYSENFQRFQGTRISWRSHEPRIRQHTGNISLAPLNDLVRPGTTIDEQSQSPGKNDVKSLHLATLHTQHFACIQLSNGPVCYQPLQLRPGRRAQGFVFRQPIDKISCYHWRAISQSEEELSPNNISDGKLNFVLRERLVLSQEILRLKRIHRQGRSSLSSEEPSYTASDRVRSIYAPY